MYSYFSCYDGILRKVSRKGLLVPGVIADVESPRPLLAQTLEREGNRLVAHGRKLLEWRVVTLITEYHYIILRMESALLFTPDETSSIIESSEEG